MHAFIVSFVWSLHPYPCVQFWWYKSFFFSPENQYYLVALTWESRLWMNWRWSPWCSRVDCRIRRWAEVHSWVYETCICGLPAVIYTICFRFIVLILLLLHALHVCGCLCTVPCNQAMHVLRSAGYCSPVTRFCCYWTYRVMGAHYSMHGVWEPIFEKLR